MQISHRAIHCTLSIGYSMIPHVIATKKESFFEELWAMMGRRD